MLLEKMMASIAGRIFHKSQTHTKQERASAVVVMSAVAVGFSVLPIACYCCVCDARKRAAAMLAAVAHSAK